MSATLAVDASLTARVAQLLREIEQVEQARPPVEQEVAAEIGRLDLIAARGDVSPSLWLSPNPSFSIGAFHDAVLGALLMIEPDKTRKVVAGRARLRAEAWKGLRLAESERQRRLGKLQTDLRIPRARVEQARRRIEETTLEVQPRVGDDPSVWLLPPAQLDQLAASGNGRSR